MKLPPFNYESPTSVAEAIRILQDEQGSAKVIAGGQSLIPLLAFRLANPTVLVDLARIPGLNDIRVDENGVSIGAMSRWCDIERDVRLRTACPLVVAAIEHIAHYQIRNRGTIGGSLAHADPAAEMPGVAVACDAEIEIAGPDGVRSVAANEFFIGPLTTCLSHDELILSVKFPAWSQRTRWAFDEFAQRRGDFAYAGVCVHYRETADRIIQDAHIGVIGATSVPCRLAAVENALNGRRFDASGLAELAAIGAAAVDPEGDIHASADYRRALVGSLIESALLTASTRAMAS
jgi:carbon-monoxide dehydrogenase medium subunit